MIISDKTLRFAADRRKSALRLGPAASLSRASRAEPPLSTGACVYHVESVTLHRALQQCGQQKPLDNTMCFTKCCSSQIILHWWSYNEKLAAGAVNTHVSGYHRHVRWKTLHEALGPCNCWLNAIACSCHELHGTTPSMARSNATSVKEGHVWMKPESFLSALLRWLSLYATMTSGSRF